MLQNLYLNLWRGSNTLQFVLRLFKRETRKLARVFWHPTFLYLTIVGNTVLIVATTVVYYLEKGTNPHMKSYFDSLWWGISTITTVAYGDILPQTFAGRIIGIVLMYTGTVLFISFTGVVIAFLMQEEVEKEIAPIGREVRAEEKEQRKMEQLLLEIRDHLNRLEKK